MKIIVKLRISNFHNWNLELLVLPTISATATSSHLVLYRRMRDYGNGNDKRTVYFLENLRLTPEMDLHSYFGEGMAHEILFAQIGMIYFF